MSKFFIHFLIFVLLCAPVYAGRNHSDVENIGNRKINGKVAWIFPNFVSLEKEIQMGAAYSQYFEQTAKLVTDTVIVEYVDRIGQEIVKHSDAKVPFVFRVVDSDDVNAFALPGGFVYVNKGLLLETETEAELAGVLAHEIAHVTARHATEQMTKGQLMQFATMPAMLFVGGGYWIRQGIYQALGMGMSLAVLGITRDSELESDQLGTQYLWNSGYDPNAFITFFEKLAHKDNNKAGKFASFWRTHPSHENRIIKVTEEISVLPAQPEYLWTSSKFLAVQARLQAVDDTLVPSALGSTARPTLKRKTNSKSAKTAPELKKDRPTLKRD